MDILVALVSILVLLILLAAWLMAGQMVRRRPPDPPAPPGDFNLSFEHVIFAARDGVKLGGWLSGEGRRPTIVFCAGMFGSMDKFRSTEGVDEES